MDFFNDLLNSYSLLKKRKLRVVLDEVWNKETRKDTVSYSELLTLSKGKEESSSRALTVINNTISVLDSMFPGAKNDAPRLERAGKQLVTGKINIQGVGQQLGLEQVAPPPPKPSDPTNGTNGNSAPKPVGSSTAATACGGIVKWGKRTVVGKDCNTNPVVMEDLRTAIVRQLWTDNLSTIPGLNAEDPVAQEFLNSHAGASLVELFPTEDGDNTLQFLLNLDSLFEIYNNIEGVEPLGDFGNVHAKRSFFGVVSNTSKGGETLAAKFEDLGVPGGETFIPDQQQLKGAIVTLKMAMDRITTSLKDPKENFESMTWLGDNLRLVEDSKGKTRLYVSTGYPGETDAVEFDGGRQPELISMIESYNAWVEKNQEDWGLKDQDLSVPTIEYTKRDLGELSIGKLQNLTKDITETADEMMLLYNLGQTEEAVKLYEGLSHQWGANLQIGARISEATEDADVATTLECEQFIKDAEALKGVVGKDFKSFVRKMFTMRGDAVMHSGAIAAVRYGGTAEEGKKGVKTDQFLIFDDPNNAKRWNHSNKKNAMSLADAAEFGGTTVEALKKKFGMDPSFGDDTEVYLGFDTIKHTLTGGFKMATIGRPEGMVSDIVTEGNSAEHHDWNQSSFGLLGMDQSQQDAMYDVFERMNAGFGKFDQLRDAQRSGTLTNAQIQRELLASMPSLPSDFSHGVGPSNIVDPGIISPNNAREENNLEGVQGRIKHMYFLGSLQQGLRSPDPKRREASKHALAFLMVRAGHDIHDANDIEMNLEEMTKHISKRNGTLTEEMSWFMDSDDPLGDGEISFSETGFNIGALSMKHASNKGKAEGGTLHLNARQASKRRAKEKAAAKAKPTNDSTEYSSTELMHKLLEVQQLMFTNLIKE